MLRESYREDGKVKKKTLANLSNLSNDVIDNMKLALKGAKLSIHEAIPEHFQVVRTLPHGHVALILETLKKLNLDNIIRINGLKDYVIIHTLEEKYIVHYTLKAILEKINSSDFIRIHNSHIISLKHLQSIGKNTVTINNTKLPLSIKFKEQLMNFVKNNF